jgi:hypothetical protein
MRTQREQRNETRRSARPEMGLCFGVRLDSALIANPNEPTKAYQAHSSFGWKTGASGG